MAITVIAGVQWYCDRVIVDNPGDSLAPLEDLLRGSATGSRNPLIQRIIRLCKLTDRAGTGTVKLHERWLVQTGHAPVVTTDPAPKTTSIEFPWPRSSMSEHVILGAGDPVAPQVTPQVAPQVTPQVAALVAGLNCEMNRAEIMNAMGLPDRVHVATAYLGSALEPGLVQMTLPDKPRSLRHKYRLTAAGRARIAARSGAPR